ncbi:MAG: cytochrome c oxidase accessory protein CcoG [Bacteroidota bacterium]|nr:cytochrome c oxidase accessory protein CcoG [Bacteroidota bacterium]
MDKAQTVYKKDEVRDRLGIVSKEGKRKWVYPKKPKGKFYLYRTILSFFLLSFLIGTPFVKYHNEPLFLFNVIDRKFILFGSAFGPHDFFLMLVAMLVLVVSIVLFTVVYGRVFCGWICPQTIFMEMVFRKIEYWIEGDSSKQKALKISSWNKEKIIKKSAKQLIFFSISFLISNVFLSWIIGVDKLFAIATDPPREHLAGLIAILAFSSAFYGVFAWLREQACILICPYGRLQGVLLDQNSIVIAYDYKRGEPRGKIKKNLKEQTKGDCVDCNLCVDVCPTGIDIRNGTQLECINCTACIDACNAVMSKINKPKGLIRYASAKAIKNSFRLSFLSARVIGYTLVLIVLVTILLTLALTRSQIDVSILRTPGLISQQQPDNKISNLYDIKITNKTFANIPLELKLNEPNGEIKIVSNQLLIKPQEILESKFFVVLPKETLKEIVTPLTINVYSNGKKVDAIHTSFMRQVDQ